MDDYGQLLVDIAHCPVASSIRCGKSNGGHPCHVVVTTQRKESFQLPEPWSGRLDTAPIVFISSNPSINRSEACPDDSWTLSRTTDFFHNRFSPSAPWVKDGLYVLQRDGHSYSGDWVRFWASARSRSCEILGKTKSEIKPGIDFALTEVVHCKSLKEEGVKQAQDFCSKLYLGRILSVSSARILVVLGAQAKEGIVNYFGAEMAPTPNHNGVFRVGSNRMITFLPHPNERGSKKTLNANIGGEGVLFLRDHLRS